MDLSPVVVVVVVVVPDTTLQPVAKVTRALIVQVCICAEQVEQVEQVDLI